jgi:cystathionine beta-lyase/cystathionine gamma-synthase
MSHIQSILYKALESHPNHDVYKKQMRGFGGMMSIYIKGGLEEAKVFLKSCKVNFFFDIKVYASCAYDYCTQTLYIVSIKNLWFNE